MRFLCSYLAQLAPGKVVLWCYLIWYAVTVLIYFDPAPALWLNALGISVVVGIALRLGVSRAGAAAPDGWQTFRLFLTPFCVSSFSSLIKGRGFILVVPPRLAEFAVSVGACTAFTLLVTWVKYRHRRRASNAVERQ